VPEISKVDTTYEIKQDGLKLGTFKISKGGIEYLPANNSRTKTKMSWGKFHELLYSKTKKH
ncbi:MAG TPA: hypothetical protein VLB84_10195, partial [Bacteroidia bacterium]|nr:hypothetical protein [Bacteroidia bacterium]